MAFKLELPDFCKIHDVFHVDRLKASSPSMDLTMQARKLPPTKDGEYEVEAIISERVRYKKREFLVHWQGYSELYQSTWEPESHLRNAKQVLKTWRSKHKPIPLDRLYESTGIFFFKTIYNTTVYNQQNSRS